jgi:hypothetical protein
VNLFVYGQLMFAEVMQRITGHTYEFTSAELHGFGRFRLKNDVLAGLSDFPDHNTDGIVYRAIGPEAAAAIDRCVGERFERIEVTAQTEDGQWVDCDTHVLRPDKRSLLSSQEWDELDFRDDHLKAYLAGLGGPAPAPSPPRRPRRGTS